MNIWLFKDGENSPLQTNSRKMRMWILADALAENGHSVVWWCSTFLHQLKTRVATEGDHQFGINRTLRTLEAGKYRKNISMARIRHHRRLAKSIKHRCKIESPPDLIVCAYPIIEVADVVSRFGKEHNIPVILDIRDIWPETFLSVSLGPLTPLLRLYVRWLRSHKIASILQRVTKVVAVSKGFRDWAQELSPVLKDVDVIHLGYTDPFPELSCKLAAPKNLPDSFCYNRLCFLYVGTFGRSNDLLTVLKAFQLLSKEEREQAELVLAGDGEQSLEMHAVARAISSRVLFPGWLSQPQINWWLNKADVGIVPNMNIQKGVFPNKPFEYLAAGLPLLSSIMGEVEELIQTKRVGKNYQEKNPQSLCAAMQMCIRDPEKVRIWGDNARKIFLERFEAKVVYDRYVQLIEEAGRA